MVRRGSPYDPLPLAPWTSAQLCDQTVSSTYYPAPSVERVVSVSGAGDWSVPPAFLLLFLLLLLLLPGFVPSFYLVLEQPGNDLEFVVYVATGFRTEFYRVLEQPGIDLEFDFVLVLSILCYWLLPSFILIV